MKTQISKPAHSKASYSDEYKQQALELWRKSGRRGMPRGQVEYSEVDARFGARIRLRS